MIVLPEAPEIQAMRYTLGAITDRLTDVPTIMAAAGLEGVNRGRLIAAADEAERALFRLLVIAHAYMQCDAASEALEEANAEPEPRPVSELEQVGHTLAATEFALTDREVH